MGLLIWLQVLHPLPGSALILPSFTQPEPIPLILGPDIMKMDEELHSQQDPIINNFNFRLVNVP